MNNLFDGPYAVVVRVQHLLRRLIAHPTIPLSEFKLELNEWVDGTSARQVLEWANHLLKLKSRLTVIAYLRAILPVLMEFSDIPILEWQREQITFIRHLNRNVRTQRHRLAACQSLIRFVEKQTKTPFIHWRVWHSARPRIRMRNMAVMTEAQLHEVVGYLYQRKRSQTLRRGARCCRASGLILGIARE